MVAYLHGFGLLAYRKLWPQISGNFGDFQGDLKESMSTYVMMLMIVEGEGVEGVVEKGIDDIKEGIDNVKEAVGLSGGS
jgi:hypothetical protein